MEKLTNIQIDIMLRMDDFGSYKLSRNKMRSYFDYNTDEDFNIAYDYLNSVRIDNKNSLEYAKKSNRRYFVSASVIGGLIVCLLTITVLTIVKVLC